MHIITNPPSRALYNMWTAPMWWDALLTSVDKFTDSLTGHEEYVQTSRSVYAAMIECTALCTNKQSMLQTALL